MPQYTKRRGRQQNPGDPSAYTNPNPTFQQSKKWVNPKVQEDEKNKRLSGLKKNFCPKSDMYPDTVAKVEEHNREYAVIRASRQAAAQDTTTEGSSEAAASEEQDSTTNSTPNIREPFNGILTKDGSLPLSEVPTPESFVLCRYTVFTPNFALGPKDTAGWPNKAEQKYEGDDRIATDVLHSRFLGAPRVEGNATVNWQHRNIIYQYALEDFHQLQTEEFIWERNHLIAEVEFGSDWEGEVDNYGDGTGRDVIGWELFDAVDPVGRW